MRRRRIHVSRVHDLDQDTCMCRMRRRRIHVSRVHDLDQDTFTWFSFV
jgi:hypothetical protein